MNGIFGIVNLDGQPVEHADLQRMRSCLGRGKSRGGDAWSDASVALGQVAAGSVSEASERPLPRRELAGGRVIAADARIDNCQELAVALSMDPAAARHLSDSEFVLAAFARWGRGCVERLLGDFAFAVWDPAARTVFLARDAMGVRPLYYALNGQSLVFASSALAVAAASCVGRELNSRRVADFLAGGLEGVNDTETFFRGVRRLPPAHSASFDAAGWQERRYWRPQVDGELRLGSDEEYVDALDEVLGRAIDARLRGPGPTGAMVSGGVDSSVIAAKAVESLGGRDFGLRTFSGVSTQTAECRETRNIHSVLARLACESDLLEPSDIGSGSSHQELALEKLEEPFDAHCVMLALIYTRARQRGCTSVLDGLDGDGIASLTSNYPAYLLRSGHPVEAWKEIRGLSRHYYQGGLPAWRGALAAAKPLLAPKAFWRDRWRKGCERMAQNAAERCYLAPDLLRQVNLADRYEEMLGHYHFAPVAGLRQLHALRVTAPFLTAATERYGRLASASGIQASHPLLDRRVVEFFVAMPRPQLVRDGWSKYLLRRLAARYLPGAVAWREGWDALGGEFLQARHSRDRHIEQEKLFLESGRWREFIDVDRLRAGLNRDSPGELGEPERNVVYLLRWLAQIHGEPAPRTSERIGSLIAS